MEKEKNRFRRGSQIVNRCTLRNHLKCVYITGQEVFKDGSQGKKTRHWWRMSYIGRACVKEYGVILGTVYEAIFAIPHYVSIAFGNGFGMLVYLFKGVGGKRG